LAHGQFDGADDHQKSQSSIWTGAE